MILISSLLENVLLFFLLKIGIPISSPYLPEFPKRVSEYTFLQLEKNHLQSLGKPPLQSFFQKLYTLEQHGRGQVHILHIGDSHIQADFFSGKMRQLFKKDPRFPLSARGFLFPYTLAKTNNPENYKISTTGSWQGYSSLSRKRRSRWGIAGVSAWTKDFKNTVRIQLDRNYQTRRMKIFFPTSNKKMFTPTLITGSKNRTTKKYRKKGYLEFHLSGEARQIAFQFLSDSKNKESFLLQGLSLENDRPGVIYSATGTNGATVQSFLKCQDMQLQLAAIQPDLLILSLGTNDAYSNRFDEKKFFLNYQKLLIRIRQALPKASILLTTPGDTFIHKRQANLKTQQAVRMIKKLADKYDASIWDFYRIMGGYKSIRQWQRRGLARTDRIHFSRKGYALQGILLYRALEKAYFESNIARDSNL